MGDIMTENYRIEKDLIGEMQISSDALWGVYTARAVENFHLSQRGIDVKFVAAYGAVKLAAARVNGELGKLDARILPAICTACEEMLEGVLDEHIIVDALQGGAGTSTNMNVNEVLANRALQILGEKPGSYDIIDPLDHVNMHQSTNDTYPTALKVACIWKLRLLEEQVAKLVEEFQMLEKRTANIVKVGRTQMQDAVLTTIGREMSAYAETFGRDRWRIYKCEERLRVVNIGGTAIGTGLSAPRQYIFNVIEELRTITGLGLARGENMIDITQNADVFVEVSGILKACASNLLKVSTDLRFMSSGPDAGIGELNLPARQAGSSVMPGKVNPVIPEAVSQASMRVFAHDQAIAQAVSMGNLELNAFMPLIADSLLDSLNLLTESCRILREYCVVGITVNEEKCREHIETSSAVVTALVSEIGYQKAQEVAIKAKEEMKTIREIVIELGLMDSGQFDFLISPDMVTRLGSK